MKFRTGFVSNSSSSSFICEACGLTETAWEQPDWVHTCSEGHRVCDECRLEVSEKTDEEKRKFIIEVMDLTGEEKEDVLALSGEELNDDYEEVLHDGDYDISEEECPICTFSVFRDSDLKAYLFKLYKVGDDEVFAEIKKVNKRRRRIYDPEYVAYVCMKHNIDREQLVQTIKDTYVEYANFSKFLSEK